MIYFIEAVGAGRIKIGFTGGDVKTRLTGLRTNSPFPLEVLATKDGFAREEAWLHSRFAATRVTGEWFQDSQELRDFAVNGTIPELDIVTHTDDMEPSFSPARKSWWEAHWALNAIYNCPPSETTLAILQDFAQKLNSIVEQTPEEARVDEW